MELNEQTLEHILTRQREEYQRYVGAFAEHLESKIQAIAEGHATLREEMRLDLEAIRLEMEMMRSELSIIRRDLKEKTGRDELAVLEARVAKLEQAGRARQ
jgi:hypothetical protein